MWFLRLNDLITTRMFPMRSSAQQAFMMVVMIITITIVITGQTSTHFL